MSVAIVSHVERFCGNQGNITQTLNDISFAVEEREFTAVMGANGSGRTTLLSVISTIGAISAGNIEIDGSSICELREGELAGFHRKELGFTFQDLSLLDTLTLQENIALLLTLLKKRAKRVDPQVNTLAEILQIQDILEKYPYQVSGGQYQRCAYVRAVIHDPSLILADEPTDTLDSRSSYPLTKQFQGMNTKLQATILMVTHDAFSTSYTKCVLLLEDGTIFNGICHGSLAGKVFSRKILGVMQLLGGGVRAIR